MRKHYIHFMLGLIAQLMLSLRRSPMQEAKSIPHVISKLNLPCIFECFRNKSLDLLLVCSFGSLCIVLLWYCVVWSSFKYVFPRFMASESLSGFLFQDVVPPPPTSVTPAPLSALPRTLPISPFLPHLSL